MTTTVEDTTYYQNLFLDYVNNFSSVDGFANHYNFTNDQALAAISIGRKIHKTRTKAA